ncbi:MAG: cytochrome P450 [Sandaracinaceae bacterium]|nr:cytochrome P450 [Sandaracinaceae bacterium]
MNTTTTTPRRREAPVPDRIELDGAEGAFRPFLVESLRDALGGVIHREPAIPRSRRAPEPSGADPLLGHLREGVGDPLTAFLRWRAEVGDVARMRLGPTVVHLVSHPDLVREVLKDRHREFVKPLYGRKNLAKILGNGLLVSEGDFWLRQRRIAQPAFHKKRIDAFGARMVIAAEALGDEWASRDAPFDVARDMMRVTLRIVQETLLGAEPTQDSDRIFDSVSYLIAAMNQRFRRVIAPPESWPTPANLRFARHREVLDETVASIIRQRRARPGEGDDLLSMLLETVDEETGESMDDRQLRDEVMTIFLAGHETTANALSWTFYLLGKHPEVARRLREELRAVLGGRPPTADDYRALEYTRMVFSEAMRLYPPAWILARAPRVDTELGGYLLEGGSRMFISPWVVHRHPDVWPDPEGFDPERFRDPKAIDPFAFFPFGGGRRMCIGQGFAMLEGVLILASLAQRFHLELVPGHPVAPEAMVTLRPKHGVRVVARKLA